MITFLVGLSWRIRMRHRLLFTLFLACTMFDLSATIGHANQDNPSTPAPLSGESDSNLPCFDGRLRIRDLEGVQDSLAPGIAHADEIAKSWEADSRLFILRLGCPLLDTGYQWEGTYFSEAAQAFFETDTRAVQASEYNPEDIPTLSTDGLQVLSVYRSLLRAGFDESSMLGAVGGVTVRPSTEAQPFGPPSAPRDDVYFHVSILERGQVIDVWIGARDGTVYRYDVPAER